MRREPTRQGHEQANPTIRDVERGQERDEDERRAAIGKHSNEALKDQQLGVERGPEDDVEAELPHDAAHEPRRRPSGCLVVDLPIQHVGSMREREKR
ncbi:hypothetical protein XA68_12883 [Ophiocordyceps unilateralis]|uniref:Uncharacterized protein n=1 Tax=Ophiocordyceps unilateralis TaxID=268505 RepID=A0A2A9PBZ3_OPHUN|nr:hypothetical protein XA68_12883 [Ophiocordyceps unilateralis]